MTDALTLTPLAAVLLDLREGLGVEDISVRRSMPLDQVREIVSGLRADGILSKIQWNVEDFRHLVVTVRQEGPT